MITSFLSLIKGKNLFSYFLVYNMFLPIKTSFPVMCDHGFFAQVNKIYTNPKYI